MKLSLALLPLLAPYASAVVYISELHYDNAGADTNEFVEITGPAGTDLAKLKLTFYSSGSTGSVATRYTISGSALSGIIPDQGSTGYGAVAVPTVGLQNGPYDGLSLSMLDGTVIELLSYEGVLTASGGPADGRTSTDIGVFENGNGPVGQSLQKTGPLTALVWQPDAPSTRGALNAGKH